MCKLLTVVCFGSIYFFKLGKHSVTCGGLQIVDRSRRPIGWVTWRYGVSRRRSLNNVLQVVPSREEKILSLDGWVASVAGGCV